MSNQSLENFWENFLISVCNIIDDLSTQNLEKIANFIFNFISKGHRLHFTGVGKSSYVARYMSALYSSIGIPSYFLDCTEAIHGSSGQVVEGDIVIAVSNSGETEELKYTVKTLRDNKAYVIGISKSEKSWLAKNSDYHLVSKVHSEGDYLNKPPRASVVGQILVLQSLSILLQDRRNLSLEEYVKWHPAGKIGESIKTKT